MIFEETYTLGNGVKIPKLGLGTWLMDDQQAARAVLDAVKIGYRHIDTAQAYGNESGVGEGVRTSGVPREKIFITSKIAAEVKDYDAATASIDETLKRLGLEYIDMMIIHAPQPWEKFRDGENRYFAENRQVWKALEDACKAGKVRAIGVSNFLKDDLDNILEDCEVKPMVNQVLAHISNTPFALAEYCQRQGILIEAYSPIAHGAVLSDAKIKAIADKYQVSVPALCVRYVLQLGMVALPKTANPQHMKANAAVDFTVANEDMRALQSMEKIKDYGKDGYFPVFAKG